MSSFLLSSLNNLLLRLLQSVPLQPPPSPYNPSSRRYLTTPSFPLPSLHILELLVNKTNHLIVLKYIEVNENGILRL
jgi:hypothetical protein